MYHWIITSVRGQRSQRNRFVEENIVAYTFTCLRAKKSLWAVCVCWLFVGCAGPAPKLFDASIADRKFHGTSRVDRYYDTDKDGSIDYIEEQSDEGIVALLKYDTNRDGKCDLETAAPAFLTKDVRDLVIIVDSVPYPMVEELWQSGHFRQFNKPGRVISPFPVMTDLCLTEFFGLTPCRAVEASYYDGRKLSNRFHSYLNGDTSPWLCKMDYHLRFLGHSLAYLNPEPWFDHELRRIQRHFLAGDSENFVAYCVGTSALGAQRGRSGHLNGLIRLDKFCQWLIHETKGQVQITLLSDHGHNLMPSTRLDLREALKQLGFNVCNKLNMPSDVVVPEYGIVTCAGVYTGIPNVVAHALVSVDGVDLVAYLDQKDDQVVICDESGTAKISKLGDKYCYKPVSGDPLQLAGVLERLRAEGKGRDGFFSDDELFAATCEHVYPDGVHRMWRAFHGLVKYTPDVLICVEDGYHCGSKMMTDLIDLQAAHGNLFSLSSCGFAMSTAGSLPPVIRMENLRKEFSKIDISVD